MNHFQDFDFNNDTKKYLKKSAIPIPYRENAFFHVRTPINTYSSKILKHNSPSMSTSKQYSPTKSIYIPTPTKINSSRVSEQTTPILNPKTQHLIQNSINMPSPLKFKPVQLFANTNEDSKQEIEKLKKTIENLRKKFKK
jgi:hypothetical protein